MRLPAVDANESNDRMLSRAALERFRALAPGPPTDRAIQQVGQWLSRHLGA
ncbi:hypothetical protein ACWIHQ_40765 [Streptomyces anulatus]